MNILKKIIITAIFFALMVMRTSDIGVAQTKVSGKISSLNGQSIPNLLITVQAPYQTDMFTQKENIRPDTAGNYTVKFHEPGIYNIDIIAVHHQGLRLPVMIFDQDSIQMDIRLVPRRYNDGKYFDKESYRNWIRVYGNFNNYDFHSGIHFQPNPDGSISAKLPVDQDTIRYQVRGITGGPAPLPDEKHTHLRDNRTFEGIIISPSETDSVELRYDPQVETIYMRNIDKIPAKFSNQPRALLSFENESDYQWIKPVSLVNSTHLSYSKIDPETLKSNDQVSSEPHDSMYQIEYSGRSAKKYSDQVYSMLKNNDDLHEQQKAALYIAYMGLLQQVFRWNQYASNTENIEKESFEKPSLNFLHKLVSEVHPLHPLWAKNPNAATQLLNLSDFDHQVVLYTQRMVQEYPDDIVVRDLVLTLIEENAEHYKDAREMPEYRWIIERYGESNLARKAIVSFLRAKQDK